MRESPIKKWKEIIFSKDISKYEIEESLRDIYKFNFPLYAELIVNSYCPNRCRHCIYPDNYHIYNKSLPLSEWKEIINKIHFEFGITKFILDGRGFSRVLCDIANYIKDKISGSEVGIIVDGVSSFSLKDLLFNTYFDWVDISIDGLKNDHNRQRNDNEAFTKTLIVLDGLLKTLNFKKLSVLSCLTTLNYGTIIEMIKYLNHEKGVKNFFISPVEGIKVGSKFQPPRSLFLDKEVLRMFINRLISASKSLTDTWLEVDLYGVDYAIWVWDKLYSLSKSFFHAEIISNNSVVKDNPVFITYNPLSINNTKELIVNSDGSVIVSKSMGYGKIPEEYRFFNILMDSDFSFYNKKPLKYLTECLEEEKNKIEEVYYEVEKK